MSDHPERLTLADDALVAPDIAEIMAREEAELGFVPNVLRVLALREPYLRAWAAMMDDLVAGPSALTEVQRELIAVVVSATNRCHYCMLSHGAKLGVLTGDPVLVDQLMTNHRAALLPPLERALADLAVAVTRRPDDVGAADWLPLRELGVADADIFTAIAVAGMFNMTNRVLTAVAAEPNPEYHDIGRNRP